MRKLQPFLDADYLEDLNPKVFYEVRARLRHVGKILVKWNAKKLEGDESMSLIWNILKEISEDAWKYRKEILDIK